LVQEKFSMNRFVSGVFFRRGYPVVKEACIIPTQMHNTGTNVYDAYVNITFPGGAQTDYRGRFHTYACAEKGILQYLETNIMMLDEPEAGSISSRPPRGRTPASYDRKSYDARITKRRPEGLVKKTITFAESCDEFVLT
jgi:hypothetical protein